jgi:hypothetical protein
MFRPQWTIVKLAPRGLASSSIGHFYVILTTDGNQLRSAVGAMQSNEIGRIFFLGNYLLRPVFNTTERAAFQRKINYFHLGDNCLGYILGDFLHKNLVTLASCDHSRGTLSSNLETDFS